MRAVSVSGFLIASLGAASLVSAGTPKPPADPRLQNYLRLPLAFERQGEGANARYLAHGQGYTVGIDGAKATIGVVDRVGPKGKQTTDPQETQTVERRAVSLEFAGARRAPATPGPELPGKVNRIVGNDPSRWKTGLATFEKVGYSGIYPGIDVVYYGNQQQLEFDLVVKPGADPRAIRLKVGGVGKLSIDRDGALNLGEAAGGLRVALPKIYQDVNGAKKSVAGRYAVVGRDEVAFKVDRWDRSRALVIDPTIVYSAIFGGGLSSTNGYGIKLDSSGNIVIAGVTWAADFPLVNAAQSTYNGTQADVFVTKINPAGTSLIYSTYLGGTQYNEAAGLAVDSAGSAWVTGWTESTDFPLLNAAQTTFANAFVTKLSATGALQFSTYLGGNSGYAYGQGIAVDSSGNGYVTGWAYGSFPTTAGAFQTVLPGCCDAAFATKYSAAGAVVYSTYLGGTGGDYGQAIAVDSAGDAYVTGYSYSGTFTGAPAGGAQTSNGGGGDAFVARLNPGGTALTYFTFLGRGGYDQGTAIAVDASGNAYIGGNTSSTGLATPGAAETTFGGGTNAFIAKLNAAGTGFAYVTYLGGSRLDNLTGLAIDGSGNAYVTGYTDSINFPVVSPLQATFPGNGVSLVASSNSGGTWSTADSNLPGAVTAISLNPAGTSAVVLTEAGIYRTVNGGGTWTLQFSSQFTTNTTVIARSPVAPATIYAGNCCTTVYRSTDDGVTWSTMGYAPSQSAGMVADPLTAGTLYVFGYGTPSVSKSTDGGATWNSAATGLPGQVYSMAATTDGALYAGTSTSGIYKSTNHGGTWTAVNTGLPANLNYGSSNALSASGTKVYFAFGTIYETTNGGASWAATASVPGGGAYNLAVAPQNASVLYAITYSGAVQESLDGGATWNSPGTGLPPNLQTYTETLVIDPTTSAHVFGVLRTVQATFVAKLNGAGSALTWSTYLGGADFVQAYAIATDGAGDAFVTGFGGGNGFPVTSTALPGEGAFITKISDATAACAETISPGNQTINPYGQTLTYSVTAPSGCAWTASSNQTWATITSGASGTGAGTVTVQVAYNSNSSTQTAILTVGAQSVAITEPSYTCTYNVDSSLYTAPVAGGQVPVVLTVASGCPWMVTNNNPGAISVSPSSGTTGTTITLTVTANPSPDTRTLYLYVEGTQIQVVQPGTSPQVVTPPTDPGQNEVLTAPRSTVAEPLLFPFVTSANGFDTEIVISNTSVDTLGSTPQSGTCTLNYYGNGAPAGSQTSNTIQAGQQLVFRLSQGGGGVAGAPNFTGYIVANCTFPLARGSARPFYGTEVSLPSDAQVLTLPRSTPATTNILIPFASNQNGFETGIAISNTSADPFGTAHTSGSCTLNFYSANGVNPIAVLAPNPNEGGTNPYLAGETYAFTLTSALAQNASNPATFTGYIISQCNFSEAAGFGFLVNGNLGSASVYATAVTPEILSLPRTSTPQPLLFSSVTNQGGKDTSISIANTSADPFGASGATPSSQACTLTFYGTNAPSPTSFTTPSIAAGSMYSTTVSALAPNFAGYVMASCGFPQVRGFALVLNPSAKPNTYSEAPEVVQLPRSAANATLLFNNTTNQNSNDTNFAISNTSLDSFLTTPGAGPCTISYFGSNAPAPQVSSSIAAGSQLAFSLSQGNPGLGIAGAPGFRGYTIANCAFPLARGVAEITGTPAGLTITTTSLPGGAVGAAYSQTLAGSGGTSPYSNWAVATGSLPPGLTLNASTGVISGTPTSATGSPFGFTVTMQDSLGHVAAARSLSITIAPFSILALTPNTASAGSGPQAFNVAGMGLTGAAKIVWTTPGVTPAQIPPSLIAAAQMAATIPAALLTTAGTAQVAVADPTGTILSNQLPFVITAALPTLSIATTAIPAAAPVTVYSTTLTATGGNGTYTWKGSGLPAWLTLSAGGVLSGTPPNENSVTFVANVTSGSLVSSRTFSLSANSQTGTHNYRIDTIAGQIRPSGVPGTGTFLQSPQGLAFDTSGNLYIVDVNGGIVRKVNQANTSITTVAGTYGGFASGMGGPALSASFETARYVAFDPTGNMFISDWGACTVDRVDAATQVVTVYAGTSGSCGFAGDGLAATSAQLGQVRGIALDSNGVLFIADATNSRVRRVDPITGIITTYAGNGSTYSGDSGPAASAGLGTPVAVTLDGSGNLFIGAGARVRRVDKTSLVITTYAGTGNTTYNGENIAATSANFGNPRGLAFDTAGDLYISDNVNLRIHRVDASTKLVTTIAGNGTFGFSGDGGPATSASFVDTEGMAFDAAGNLYFADFSDNRVRKLTNTGGGVWTISTFAGSLGSDNVNPLSAFLISPQDALTDGNANILTANGLEDRLRQVNSTLTNIQTLAGVGYPVDSGDGAPAVNAGLYYPWLLARDAAGNTYIAESSLVRRIDLSGNITTVAGSNTSTASAASGAAATSVALQIGGIAVNSSGTLYISDDATNRIWAVVGGTLQAFAGNGTAGTSPNGTVATAAMLRSPEGIKFDSANNLFIADSGNALVRKVLASNGQIFTVAGNGTEGYDGDGNLATLAEVSPYSLAVAPNGDLFIGEVTDIRLVTFATGLIETVAGTGVEGFSGDTGPARLAQISSSGINLDSAGRLLIADSGNNVIRRLSMTSSTVSVTTVSLPAGMPGVVYSTTLAATGGTGTYSNWALASGSLPPGLSLNAATGVIGGTPTAAATNPYGFSLTVRDSANTFSLPVNLTIQISLFSISNLTPNSAPAGSGATALSVGGTNLTNAAKVVFTPPGGAPTQISPSLIQAAQLAATIPAALLTTAGTAQVAVSDTTGSILSNQLPFTIGAPSSAPVISAVVAGGGSGGTLAPGELASIFGATLATTTQVASGVASGSPLPKSLAGVTVTVNGLAAPIQFVSPYQLNIQIPYSTATGNVSVIVSDNGATSNAFQITVAPVAPAFVYGIYNASDGNANSAADPAAAGSVFFAYVNGVGALNPALADGASPSTSPFPTPVTPISFTLNGVAITPLFIGASPGLVGMLQANFTVPAGMGVGSYTLALTQGSSMVSTTVYVGTPTLVISPPANLGTFEPGTIQYGLGATGGTGSYVWTLAGGALPPGLALRTDTPSYFSSNQQAGLIGVATTPGNYSFTLSVTSGGQTQSQTFSMRITALNLRDQSVSLPDAFVNVPFSYVFSAVGTAGPVTFSVNSSAGGLTLSAGGVLSGTPVTPGNYTLNFNFTDTVDTVYKSFNFTVYAVDITSPGSLPNATQNSSYNVGLTSQGGTGGYTYSITGGSLPNGLTLSSGGAITGTPTYTGVNDFYVQSTDSSGNSYTKNMTIAVVAANPSFIYIGPYGNFDDGTVGDGYSRGISVCCGGAAPFVWTVSGLPTGMSVRSGRGIASNYVNADDAEIWGIPEAAGNYNIQVTVTDATGASVTETYPFHVSTLDETSNVPGGTVSTAYAGSFRVLGGTAPYTMKTIGGQLPAGMTLNTSTFQLGGTPIETGGFNIVLQYMDSNGATLERTHYFNVSGGANANLNINTGSNLGNVATGSTYSQQLSACCATSYVWSLAGGALPSGIGLSSSGLLSGTAAPAGSYTFLIKVADASNAANVAYRQFTLGISGTPLTVTNNGLPSATVSTAYSKTLTATGGSGTLTWSLNPFSYLPPGLTLASNGAITGTPTAIGNYNFSVTVTDTSGDSATSGFGIVVDGPGEPVTINTGTNLGTWVVGDAQLGLAASGGTGTYTWSLAPPAAQVNCATYPTGYFPFSSVFSITAPDAAGDRLIVGNMSLTQYNAMINTIAVPSSANQEFCGPVSLASGYQVSAYVPTAAERSGNFSAFSGLLIDPLSGSAFPGGIIPSSRIGGIFAWRVSSALPPGLALRADIAASNFGNGAQAALLGVATTKGTYTFNLTATSGSQSTSETFTMRVTNLNVKDVAVGLPDAFANTAYSYAFTAVGTAGPITFTATSSAGGLTLSSGGVLSGTIAAPGSYTAGFTLTDGVDTISRTFGFTVYAMKFTSPGLLTNATQNSAYSYTLAASGGAGGYTYAVTNGSLPNGLTISSAGVISGTPTSVGQSWFDVQATDTNGANYTKNFSIVVTGVPAVPPRLQIYGNFDDGVVGDGYGRGLNVCCGGTAPFTWTVTGLPTGMSMRSGSGIASNYIEAGDAEIWGVPQAPGQYSVQVTVTDATGSSVSNTFPFHVSTLDETPSLPNGLIGVPYSSTLRVLGGSSAYTVVMPGGSLPAGMTFNPTTLLVSGTPVESGSFNPTFVFTDATGATLERTIGFTIFAGSNSGLTINTGANLGTAGLSSYSLQFSANGASSYTWSLVAGGLPTGATLTSGGLLSGTLTVAGTYTFLLKVADASNSANFAERQFMLVVSGTPLTITTGSLPYGSLASPSYSTAFAATGGTGALTWSLPLFNYLPPGLSLTQGGVLSGTLTATGDYFFDVAVTDSNNVTVTRNFTLNIYAVAPPLSISNSASLGTYTTGGQQIGLGASGGNGTYVWNLVSGALPAGLLLRTDVPSSFSVSQQAGLIGVATAKGNYSFTLSVTSAGQTVSKAFTMRVTALNFQDYGSSGLAVPDAFVNVPYSYTFTALATAGPATFSATSSAGGITLSSAGVLSGTPTTAGSYSLSVSVNDGTDTVTHSYSVLVSAINITTPGMLPNGTQNAAYSTTLAATGGAGGYTWALSGTSTLPAGLTLSSGGVVSGTITAGPNMYGFGVKVTDSNNVSYTKQMTLDVIGVPATLARIGVSEVDDEVLGNYFYGVLCPVSGGTAPFSWSATGLPPGLAIRWGSGVTTNSVAPGCVEIYGIPQTAGNYNVQLTVTDASSASETQAIPFHVSVLEQTPTLPNGTVNSPYSSTFRIIGGTPPYGPAVQIGTAVLPAGLTINGAAGTQVSGTPEQIGSFRPIFQFTDSASNTLTRGDSFSIGGISGTTINITTGPNLGQTGLGGYYNQLSETGAASATWALLAGGLPPGLVLTAGGLLNGTPTATGTYTFTIGATDTSNAANVDYQTFTLVVTSTPISISTAAALPAGNLTVAYNTTLVATGGAGTLTWSLTPYNFMPAGLSLSAAGAITGTPTSTGLFSFNVTVTDAVGDTANRTFTISAYPAGQCPPLFLGMGNTTNSVGRILLGLAASGGCGGYHYSPTPGAAAVAGMRVQDGAPLPTSFSATTGGGYLGVITTPGTYNTSFRVTDSASNVYDRPVTITISPIALLDQGLPKASIGVAYSYKFTPYGGGGTYTLSATGVPAGFSFDPSSGILSGTPTAAGAYTVSIKVNDTAAPSAVLTYTYTLTINPFPIVDSGVLAQGVVNTPYTHTFSAPSCGSGCTWTSIGNAIPSGFTFSPAGVLAGTYTSTSGYNSTITIQAAGANGTVNKVFYLVIPQTSIQGLAITTNLTNSIVLGNTVGTSLSASGGVAPYTWSVSAGSLPTGVSLQAGDNLFNNSAPGFTYLAGRAEQTGTFSFTLRVTDSAGHSATKAFTWQVAIVSIEYTSLPIAANPLIYNNSWSQQLLVVGGNGSYTSWTSSPAPVFPGLAMNSSTGLVTGTPTNTGGVTSLVTVTDSASNSTSQNVTFTAGSNSSTTVTLGGGPGTGTVLVLGANYIYNLSPSGGSGAPYTITALTTLPAGFMLVLGNEETASFSSTNALQITPQASGPYSFTLQVQDSGGVIGARTYTGVVAGFAYIYTTTLANGSVGLPYSQPLIVSGGSPTFSLATGAALPPGLSLSAAGVVSGTPSQAGNYSFVVNVSDGTNIVSFTISLTISSVQLPGPFTLPPAISGIAYSYTVPAASGASLTWSATGLPSGLSMSASTGAITGTTTAGTGRYAPAITVTDGATPITRTYTMWVELQNPAQLDFPIASTALGDAIVNQFYLTGLVADGGLPPYTWTVSAASALPPGFSLLPASSTPGTIAPGVQQLGGVPTTAGQYTFTLLLADSAGSQLTRTFTINVTGIDIATGSVPNPILGQAYSFQFEATGGTAPYTYSISATSFQDMLPTGLNMTSTGLLSGTPTSTGSYSFALKVQDSAGHSLIRNMTILSTAPSGMYVSNTNPIGVHEGIGFGRITLAVNGGANGATYNWTVQAGTLPPGAQVFANSATSIVLKGRGGAPGVYHFTLRATDTSNAANYADHVFTIAVSSMQVVSPLQNAMALASLPPAQVGISYSFTFKMAGGTTPYTFTESPYLPLPPGLTLSSGGVLSGTPTTPGVYGIHPVVTDAAGASNQLVASSATLVVTAAGKISPLVAASYVGLSDASAGQTYILPLDQLLSGGTAPFTWAADPSSPLPAGLSILAGANGVSSFLAGAPTTPASPAAISVIATDAHGQTLKLGGPLNVSTLGWLPGAAPPGIVGTPYSVTFTPSGGAAPYTFSAASYWDMPPGLGLTSAGVLSGTPTVAGNFLIYVTLTDNAGTTMARYYQVTIDDATGEAPAISLGPDPVQIAYPQGAPSVTAPLTVSSTSGAIPFTIAAPGLTGATFTVTSGTTPASPTLTLAAPSLTAGTYLGLVAASASSAINSGDVTPVVVTVTGVPPSVFVDIPAPNSTLSGTVAISGWAIENANTVGPNAVSTVAILLDGNQVGMATYGSSRADVCVAFPGRLGCPNVGWTYTLNLTSVSGGAHVLKAVATDTAGVTGSSVPVPITVAAVVPYVDIESPGPGATLSGTTAIGGWAVEGLSQVGPNAITSVAVFVDGTQVGTATYGLSRPDVCAALPGRPGCNNVGWTYNLNVSSLSAGSHTLKVTATDSAAVAGSSSVTINVQPVAPYVNIEAPAPNATLSGTSTISGWAVEGLALAGPNAITSITVLVDGAQVGTGTYGISRPDVCAALPGRPGCNNVGWTYSLNTGPFSAGTHTLQVVAKDSAGVTGSSSVQFKVAAIPPYVKVDTPVANATLTGTTAISGWAVEGLSAAGPNAITTVAVLVDGSQVGTATYGVARSDVCTALPGRPSCPNVGWTYNLNVSSLSAGSHTLTITATDSASVSGTSAAVSFTVSPVLPWVSIELTPGTTLSGTAAISGWSVEGLSMAGPNAIASVAVFVDNVQQAGTATYGINRPDVCSLLTGRPGCPNVGWSYNLNTTPLANGSHTLKVVATDTASNQGSSTVNFNVMAPVVLPWVSIELAANSTLSGVTAITGWSVEGLGAVGPYAIATVALLVDGTQVGTATYGTPRPDVCAVLPGRLGCNNVGWTYNLDVTGLTSGSHTLMVVATDTAGNSGSSSVPFSSTSVVPWVSIELAPNTSLTGTTEITGWSVEGLSAVGPNAIASVAVFVDNVQVGTATYGTSRPDVCTVLPGRMGCPNVGWTYNLNVSGLTSGSHVLKVVATDAVGVTGSSTVTFSNAVTPFVFIDTPAANATLSGVAAIGGWAVEALNVEGPNAVSSVTVWVDGTQVGTATYGTARGDVCVALGARLGCPNVGWSYNLDVTSLTAGSHVLKIVATDTASISGSNQVNFTK